MMELSNIVDYLEILLIFIYLYFIDNRLLEANSALQIQCIKFEKDIHHLRLANAGLEKASEARFVDLNRTRINLMFSF